MVTLFSDIFRWYWHNFVTWCGQQRWLLGSVIQCLYIFILFGKNYRSSFILTMLKFAYFASFTNVFFGKVADTRIISLYCNGSFVRVYCTVYCSNWKGWCCAGFCLWWLGWFKILASIIHNFTHPLCVLFAIWSRSNHHERNRYLRKSMKWNQIYYLYHQTDKLCLVATNMDSQKYHFISNYNVHKMCNNACQWWSGRNVTDSVFNNKKVYK